MNDNRYEARVKPSPNSFWKITPYENEFRYLMQLSADECLARLYRLQPSRTVNITYEANHVQFEICIKRYDRKSSYNDGQFVYNSAVANGIIISSHEHPENVIIEGSVRHEILLWRYVFVLAMFTLMTAFTGYLIFALIGLALCVFFIRRDYNDYRKLEILIHDTFSEVVTVTNEQPQ
jgi:hypothetical protein